MPKEASSSRPFLGPLNKEVLWNIYLFIIHLTLFIMSIAVGIFERFTEEFQKYWLDQSFKGS